MGGIQIGRRGTYAGEFIEVSGSSVFCNADGAFVAEQFVEVVTPNISKIYRDGNRFTTFELIETGREPDEPQFPVEDDGDGGLTVQLPDDATGTVAWQF